MADPYANTTPWADPPEDDNSIPPMIGGMFRDTEGEIMAWSGFDPDQEILSFGYQRHVDADANVLHLWICNTDKLTNHSTWMKIKGPVHPVQYRQRGPKAEQKTRERCTAFD